MAIPLENGYVIEGDEEGDGKSISFPVWRRSGLVLLRLHGTDISRTGVFADAVFSHDAANQDFWRP